MDWAAPYLSVPSKLYRIMDPALAGMYSVQGAQVTASVAASCLNLKAKERPRMSAVVQALLPAMQLKDMAGLERRTPQGREKRVSRRKGIMKGKAVAEGPAMWQSRSGTMKKPPGTIAN